jgi:hypothetical protein
MMRASTPQSRTIRRADMFDDFPNRLGTKGAMITAHVWFEGALGSPDLDYSVCGIESPTA